MINEFRRAPRRRASDTILVTDVMSERVIGRVGNLSESGMLLIASEQLIDDGLYQLGFALPLPASREVKLEAGMHLLWTDHASAPGQTWTGLRFITIDDESMAHLREWIESPGGQFE